MSRKLISGFALAGLLIAGSASAAESRHALPQSTGITTDLGNSASAETYWVDEADGIHVVTTIDTVAGGSAERHDIVRFSALMLPGQTQVISVPGTVGAQPQALRIRRLSNHLGGYRIEVDRIDPPQLQAQISTAGQTN